MEGEARFIAGGQLTLDGEVISADKIILATGSRPQVPDIPGLTQVRPHDSTSILEVQKRPASLIVMGGGYIGVELAQVFARTGTAVTIVSRRGLLPEAEPEIGNALTRAFEDEGIIVRTIKSYTEVMKRDGHIALRVETEDGTETLEAEDLLLATGRTPNTQNLALDLAGIATDRRGAILVDDRMRTSHKNVYAAGDVTGRDQFVYMAACGAKLAAKNAMNGDSLVYDNTTMPQSSSLTLRLPASVSQRPRQRLPAKLFALQCCRSSTYPGRSLPGTRAGS